MNMCVCVCVCECLQAYTVTLLNHAIQYPVRNQGSNGRSAIRNAWEGARLAGLRLDINVIHLSMVSPTSPSVGHLGGIDLDFCPINMCLIIHEI